MVKTDEPYFAFRRPDACRARLTGAGCRRRISSPFSYVVKNSPPSLEAAGFFVGTRIGTELASTGRDVLVSAKLAGPPKCLLLLTERHQSGQGNIAGNTFQDRCLKPLGHPSKLLNLLAILRKR